jgi:hypothetical protein
MINFTKLYLKNFKPHGGLNLSFSKNFGKNFFNSSQVKKDKKSNSEKIDLKQEFEEMLKTNKISEDELKLKTMQEEQKKKETIDNINKEYEERNKNLKDQWEQKRNTTDEENDTESKIKLDHIKKKVKSAFFFNKMSAQEGKTTTSRAESETKEEKIEEETKQEKKEENKFDEKTEKKTQSKSITSEPGSLHKLYKGFLNVWKQTFPGEENMDLLFEKRRQEAQILKSKIKEPTEEEIEQLEAAIPEWKRGAVVLVQDDSATEKIKISILDIAKNNLTRHVKNLKVYKDAQKSYENSELSLLMEDLKTSYSNVRDNLKESQNPLLVVSRDLVDRVPYTSSSAQATSIMRKHDPNFDIILFEKEVTGIFKQLMTSFINDDLDTVKLIAGEVALALLTNEIKSRRERVKIFNNQNKNFEFIENRMLL